MDSQRKKVLEQVLNLVTSPKDRSSVSLVCKDWYDVERHSRRHVFIGNCYSVSPEIVTWWFPNIRSVTLKGRPRFSNFNLVPPNWGSDVRPWLDVFTAEYPQLEELRLKRMTVSDNSLEFLAASFADFKALSLLNCDGFSTDGLEAIATDCKNLTLCSTEPAIGGGLQRGVDGEIRRIDGDDCIHEVLLLLLSCLCPSPTIHARHHRPLASNFITILVTFSEQ
ncbi:hypothetical protein ACFX13_036675 [Malus domestica]